MRINLLLAKFQRMFDWPGQRRIDLELLNDGRESIPMTKVTSAFTALTQANIQDNFHRKHFVPSVLNVTLRCMVRVVVMKSTTAADVRHPKTVASMMNSSK